jgi:hypothetical protein
MMRRSALAALGCAVYSLASLFGAGQAVARQHLAHIAEVFTTADGSVQYIELFIENNNQDIYLNLRLTSSLNTLVFPNNLPTNITRGCSVLIVSPGYEALRLAPGGMSALPAPDFVLPVDNFFNPAGDTIDFLVRNPGGVGEGSVRGQPDAITFQPFPTDGFTAVMVPDLINDDVTDVELAEAPFPRALLSPQNFASCPQPTPPPPAAR